MKKTFLCLSAALLFAQCNSNRTENTEAPPVKEVPEKEPSYQEEHLEEGGYVQTHINLWAGKDMPVAEDNYFYCSVSGYMWKMLMEKSKGPVITTEKSEAADNLNQDKFYENTLSPSHYITYAGPSSNGMRYVSNQMEERFGKQPVNMPAGAGTMLYAYVIKNFTFPEAYGEYTDKLKFKGKTVKSFGVEEVTDDNHYMMDYVNLQYYKNDEEFIVSLGTKTDRVTLAKIPRGENLAEMHAYIGRKIEEGKKERLKQPGLYRLNTGDRLQVPELNMNLNRSMPELLGMDIINMDMAPIDFAMASCRLKLNNKGVEMEMEMVETDSVASPIEPRVKVKQKNLVFDKPFLMQLQEQKKPRPYFMLWIGNDELMIKPAVL